MKILQDRLIELRTERGITQKELAIEIGVSASAIGFWENGINEPKATYLSQIARFFDVTTDYLLGVEDEFGAKQTSNAIVPPVYSQEEIQLIETYRTLNPACKKLVKQTVETLYSSSKTEEQNKKINKN